VCVNITHYNIKGRSYEIGGPMKDDNLLNGSQYLEGVSLHSCVQKIALFTQKIIIEFIVKI